MLFLALKFVHILCAILAIGLNAAYGLILGRARRGGLDGREMAFALKTVKVMDDRVANPCYVLLGVTGVSMVILEGYSWSYKLIPRLGRAARHRRGAGSRVLHADVAAPD